MLSIRKWLGVLWLTYVLLPTVILLLTVAVVWLVTGGDKTRAGIAHMPILVAPAVIAQLSVPIVAAVLLGLAILRPLAAMSKAAGQVAKQDLDFRLPSSRVREVNEATTAFTAMGEELRAALAREAELEQERQFFISAIAHDIHSPIFALRGYLEGLERGVAASPERAQHYVRICQEKVGELERLAADLFAYTEADRPERTIDQTPLDLGMLLSEITESLRPATDARALTLELDAASTPCICLGDAHLLGRVATNLLENAIRYTPEGGTITLRWRAEGEDLCFSVADTGSGIAAGDLPHIFTPFYRGDTSRNRFTGGVGLGLAIAQRIMHAHNGTLTATNASSGGSVFTGMLPAYVQY